MLDTLKNADTMGVPIGLSDLCNPEFNAMVDADYIAPAWVDVGSIKAYITDRGRAVLNDLTMLPAE